MNKNTLRKKLSYDGIIKKYDKFEIPLPNRKATDIMNHPIISNLLFDNDFVDERHNDILKFDKFTQTPHEKSTQTDILDKETQEYYKLQHHDLYPHLYYKIDAFSKYMPNNKNIVNKNDAFAGIISTDDKNKYDSIVQTSNYIPSSLKEKSDNINQTVRYLLKETKPIDESSGDYQEWYDSLHPREPEVPEPNNNPGLWDWLIGLALPDPPTSDPPVPPSNPSEPPSVPSASIQSPSESPPETEISYIPPSPPSSPSPVAYPESVSSNEEQRSRSSIKSGKNKK